MNYLYRIDNEDFVLSQEEDTYVRGLQAKGEKGIVLLRNGDLRINLPFIRFVKETNRLTTIQEEKREKLLLTGPVNNYKYPQNKGGQNFLKLTHKDYYAAMGWDHAENCSCKKVESNLSK